jgi:hypothetical protein
MTALADFLTTAAYGFSFISALIFVRGLRLTEARRTSFLDKNYEHVKSSSSKHSEITANSKFVMNNDL